MDYASVCGVALSWLSGRNRAADAVLKSLDDLGRAELYGYAVDCSLKGFTPGNLLNSPSPELYRSFAPAAAETPEILAAILKRPGSDIWKPNKNTNAYRWVSAYFD